MKTREIKFRAWDELNKIMMHDFQFIKSGNIGNDWIVFTSDKQKLTNTPHPFDNPYFQQQFIIMQFTGLLDKNGVEIYEGDIVKHAGWVCEVVYGKNGCCFSLINEGETDLSVITEASSNYIEVIGNIYESPNLLEK